MTYWRIKRRVYEKVRMCGNYLSKTFVLYQADCTALLCWAHFLKANSAHGILKKIGTMQLRVCPQPELPIQGDLSLSEDPTVRESLSHKRYCNLLARQLDTTSSTQRLLTFEARYIGRPLKIDNFRLQQISQEKVIDSITRRPARMRQFEKRKTSTKEGPSSVLLTIKREKKRERESRPYSRAKATHQVSRTSWEAHVWVQAEKCSYREN